MISVKRILFPTDFSECAERALRIAESLAERYDAELHKLHVIVWSGTGLHPGILFGMSSVEREQFLEKARRAVDERLARDAAESDRTYEARPTQVVHTSAADAIADYVDEHDIDLVVIGTHGHGPIKKLLLGSTAEKVVRTARCPVLTVRQEVDVAHFDPRRILVPVDFSDQTEGLLRHAMHLAAEKGASIDAVHVVQPQYLPAVYYGREPIPIPYDEIKHRALDHLKEVLEKVVGAAVETRPRVVLGDPVSEIIDMAGGADYDLLVIATHGYSGLKHVLLGSIAERVVRSAPCPVLVVKSFGHSILQTGVSKT